MNRRDFLKIAAGSAVLMAGCDSALILHNQGSAKRRPNLVFFLIDDMGWRDAGCFGSTFYETPNIDRLATQGIRFTNAYAACPVCSPTRASIMTGKYPARLNLTDWIPGRQSNMKLRAQMKVLPPEFEQQLGLEEVTIAEVLKEVGYVTCSVGKWHLGGQAYYPEKQGFDVNIAGGQWGSPPSYFYPYRRGNSKAFDLPGGQEGEYLTDRLTNEAVKFIEANKDRPFFLYLSHYAVHVPLQAKQEMTDRYERKAAGLPANDTGKFLPEGATQARQVQDHAVYAAMVESMDQSVGRVMTKLDELGIADNTVIIFMSDNGGLSTAEGSPTSNMPLRAGKGLLYEGGIREPMIIKWPGIVKPGSVCNEPVISTDFYPTILQMTGLPLRPEQHIDGVSLVPLLRKGTGRLQDRELYWHYPHYSNQGGKPSGAVRAGDYKLIEFYEDNRVELYNLKQDIGERHDIAGQMPEKVSELRELLRGWRQQVGARMPMPNPYYEAEKAK